MLWMWALSSCLSPAAHPRRGAPGRTRGFESIASGAAAGCSGNSHGTGAKRGFRTHAACGGCVPSSPASPGCQLWAGRSRSHPSCFGQGALASSWRSASTGHATPLAVGWPADERGCGGWDGPCRPAALAAAAHDRSSRTIAAGRRHQRCDDQLSANAGSIGPGTTLRCGVWRDGSGAPPAFASAGGVSSDIAAGLALGLAGSSVAGPFSRGTLVAEGLSCSHCMASPC